MNKNLIAQSFFLLITFIAWVSVIPRTALSQDAESRRKVWKEAHRFLFDEYLEDKEHHFSNDDKALREVTVLDQEFDGSSELECSQGTSRIIGFFEFVVFHGEFPSEVGDFLLELNGDSKKIKLVSRTEKELIFAMPLCPTPRANLPELMITFKNNEQLHGDRVSLRTRKHISRDFSLFEKLLNKFPDDLDARQMRHLAFYEETLGRSVDELIGSLSERSEAFSGVVFPGRITATTDLVVMGSIFADRRVAKIYEHLMSLDKSDAAEIAETAFVQEFDSYLEKSIEDKLLPARERYSVEANLFLCSEFCDPEVVVRHVDTWTAWHDSLIDKRSFHFKSQSGPDFHLVANLYVNMLARKENWSVSQANDWIKSNLSELMVDKKPPQLSDGYLLASDWTPNRLETIKRVPNFATLYDFPLNRVRRKSILQVLRSQFVD